MSKVLDPIALGAWANSNKRRKCVIDLSDTESEEEDDEEMSLVGAAKGALASRASVNPSPAPSSTVAASQALLEKEKEIQRMKDLIARHEHKSRLKKMGSTTTSVVPSTAPSKMPSPSPIDNVSQPIPASAPSVDPSPEVAQEPIPRL